MFAASGLDAGFLIDAENVIVRPQCCTSPAALVEIDDAASLAGEVRITREDPGTMAPGAQRILPEPAPQRCAADLRDKAARHRLVAQFGDRPSCEGETTTRRQLTGKRLDRNHNTGGKSGLVDRRAAARPGLEVAGYRSDAATY